MKACKCNSWVNLGEDILFSKHNKNCPERDIESEAKEHLINLLNALEYEAQMGDGISEEFYDKYAEALFFVTGRTAK